MPLNPVTFFKYYAFHPDDQGLSEADHYKALIGSIALGVLTLGVVHLVCRLFFYDKAIAYIQNPTKSSELFHKTLGTNKDDLPSKMEEVPAHPPKEVRIFPKNQEVIEEKPQEKSGEENIRARIKESENPPLVSKREEKVLDRPTPIAPSEDESEIEQQVEKLDLEVTLRELTDTLDSAREDLKSFEEKETAKAHRARQRDPFQENKEKIVEENEPEPKTRAIPKGPLEEENKIREREEELDLELDLRELPDALPNSTEELSTLESDDTAETHRAWKRDSFKESKEEIVEEPEWETTLTMPTADAGISGLKENVDTPTATKQPEPLAKGKERVEAEDGIELQSSFKEVTNIEKKAAEKSIPPKKAEPLPDIPLATQDKITAWSKLGKKITTPTQMNTARAEVLDWLLQQNESNITDLFKAMPDKMASIIENFPEVFAEVCIGSEIANIAAQLYLSENDPGGKAVGSMLQFIYAKAVVPANLSAGGQLKNKEVAGEFYALLLAFANTPVFNPTLENQLTAIQKKIPPNLLAQRKIPPKKLLEKIHNNIEKHAKEKAKKAEEILAKPLISDDRKHEILNFMQGLIAKPEIEHMKRRAFLTTMAKHPQRAEIPFFIQNLGEKNIEKLWIFESVVNNAAHDPTLRLTAMFSSLSDDQFSNSLASSAFLKVIARCPPAVIGLSLNRLKVLADSCSCDQDLFTLYHIVNQDKGNFYQKAEKMKILSEVVARVNTKAAAEAALLKALEPPVDVEDFATNLKATMDPTEVGKTIDKLDDGQLAQFITHLGTGGQLANFWAIQQKKVVAGSEAKQQRKRLERIFPKLSDEQIAQSAKLAGFLTVIGNTDEKYIKVSAAALSASQLAIIAKEAKMVWTLHALINNFPKGDKTIMAKLRAIGENVPLYTSVLTQEYQNTLHLLKAAADKWYVTMPEPQEGWGAFSNKKAATKYLSELFDSRFK